MTERELLELAAKAAGIDTKECPVFEYGVDWGGKAGIWNPLTDDGDALRLAVRLGIDLTTRSHLDYYQMDGMTKHVRAHVDRLGRGIREDARTDPYAAMRKAIVWAAAEIGKGMGVGE